MGKLPDFIVVGFPRCGTSATLKNLSKHPDVQVASKSEWPYGEIYFFNEDKYWERGSDWYKNLFSGKCSGENTPSYTYNNRAINRMHEVCPQVKIIICLRNPRDRAHSHYYHRIRLFEENLPGGLNPRKCSFQDAVKNDVYKIVTQGFYQQHIAGNLMKHYPRQQQYIVIQERMMRNSDKEINKLYTYLGLNEYHDIFFNEKSKYPKRTESELKTLAYLSKLYKVHNEVLYEWMGYKIKEWDEKGL